MSSDTTQKPRLWVALPTAIAAGAANVFLFFLFMVLYGHVIDPGHEDSYYQEAANRFGPYASIIGGVPVFFAAGVLLRRFLCSKALKIGITAWAIYAVIDVAIIIGVAGQLVDFLSVVAVSFATKLAAIYLGARTRANVVGGRII